LLLTFTSMEAGRAWGTQRDPRQEDHAKWLLTSGTSESRADKLLPNAKRCAGAHEVKRSGQKDLTSQKMLQ